MLKRISTQIKGQGNFLDEKNADSFLCNVASVFFCGLAGMLLPFLIGRYYEISVLGVFTQVYSFYIVFSQCGAFGVHLSLLKHVAERHAHEVEQSLVFLTGIAATLLPASFFSGLFWLMHKPIGILTASNDVSCGIKIGALGVFFFSINKSLLFSLNGLDKLKRYALYSALRYFFYLFFLFLLIFLRSAGCKIVYMLSLSECALCVFLLLEFRVFFAKCSRHVTKADFFRWMKSHFIFGGRAFWGHVLLDLNTRIDIICLGFWVDDKIVGVYGMAAVVAEGVYQFPLVLRTMYNPRIIQLLALGDILKLEFLVKRARRVVWFVMIFISMMGGLFTFYALPWLTGKSQYAESTLFFCVIMIGMSVASGYAPFNFILMNGGFPGKQSVIAFLLVSINGIGNLILIPLLGALGAAIATSISYMVSVILLKRFSWRYLKVKV